MRDIMNRPMKTALQEYNDSIVKTKDRLKYNDWILHKIEEEPMIDLNQLKVFLSESTIFLKHKLKNIKKSKYFTDLKMNKDKQDLLQVQEQELNWCISRLEREVT